MNSGTAYVLYHNIESTNTKTQFSAVGVISCLNFFEFTYNFLQCHHLEVVCPTQVVGTQNLMIAVSLHVSITCHAVGHFVFVENRFSKANFSLAVFRNFFHHSKKQLYNRAGYLVDIRKALWFSASNRAWGRWWTLTSERVYGYICLFLNSYAQCDATICMCVV